MQKSFGKFLGILVLTFTIFQTGAGLDPLKTEAGGLDLSLYYGTRYIALGGNQISINDDAYSVFYNPATMSLVDRPQIAFNSMTLFLSYEAPVTGANVQRKSELGKAPLFYLGAVSAPFWDRVSFGLAVFPTALQGGKFKPVNYGAPYTADREFGNQLVRIEITPAVSVKITDHLSFGLAPKISYTKYEKQFGSTLGTYFDSSVASWDANGLKMGALLHDIYGFSLGLTYRIQATVDMEGTTDVYSPVTPTGKRVNASQTVKIPAQLQAGISYEWIPKKLLTAFTYEFTQNSVIESDEQNFDSAIVFPPPFPALTGTKIPLKYRDGHGFHFGTEYTFDLAGGSRLRTGVGLAIDKQVTRTENQIPALPPANDYIGYALGAQWLVGDHTWGAAFNYGEYEKETKVVDPAITAAAPGAVFPGKYGLKVFLAAFDYQYKF